MSVGALRVQVCKPKHGTKLPSTVVAVPLSCHHLFNGNSLKMGYGRIDLTVSMAS